MKLSDARKKFIKHLKDLDRSPATIVAYDKDLEQLQKELGQIKTSEITTKQLQEFMDTLPGNNYSSKTVSRKLNSIKSFFKFLHKQSIVLVDPSKPIPHPKIECKLPRVLSKTEYRSLRDAAKNNKRLYTIIELMLQTGLRIGEISRLKVEHVKLNQQPPQLLVIEDGSSPMRIVELNKTAQQVIKDFLPHRLEVENDQGFLFNTKNGGCMMIRNIRSALDRIFAKAGVKGATVNDLRNTFITFQLENGLSLAKISQMAGHKRFASTEKYLPLISGGKPGKLNKIAEL